MPSCSNGALCYDHQNPRTPPFRNQSPNGRMDSAARSTGINADHQKEVIEAGDRADEKADAPTEAIMTSPLKEQVGGGHYAAMKIQPVEFITANKIPFIEGCVIKYVCRHRAKNGKQDIEKAIHFLNLLLELEYPEDMRTEHRRRANEEMNKEATKWVEKFCRAYPVYQSFPYGGGDAQ